MIAVSAKILNNAPINGENALNKKISFKATNNDTFVKQTPMSYEERLAKAQAEREKEIKKQKRKQNLSWGVGIASGLAIIGMVIGQLYMMKKGAGNAAGEQLDELSKVVINWIDMKGQKTVASLDSATTAPGLKEALNNFKKLTNIDSEILEQTGYKPFSKFIYMFGESGVGKTYSSKQIAQELDAMYACIKFSDLGSPFKDAGSMKVANLFKGIREKAKSLPDRPFVLCLDEADAILAKVPDSAHGAEEARKLRATLLASIDELQAECDNVIVVLTSNYHPKSGYLSDAVKRRLQYEMCVNLPGIEQTEALLKLYLKDCKISEEFFNTPEFKNFVQDLVNNKYANGEIADIAKLAQEKYTVKLIDTPKEQRKVVDFSLDLLKEARIAKGDAAAKTNHLMDAGKGAEILSPEETGIEDFNKIIEKIVASLKEKGISEEKIQEILTTLYK